MDRWLASCACLLVLVSGCVRLPPRSSQPHSKATLVIEQSAAAPGSKVNVGIQFVTDSGWHIYWQNPGDSGEPPRMQWQLPAGVTAGELEWPTPMRLTTRAGTDFGYQGTTVLLSTLQIPPSTPPGHDHVGGDLRWLVCHDICLPQSAHLEAPSALPAPPASMTRRSQLLQSAAERLPVAAARRLPT